MNPILLTFLFLSLLAILTTSNVKRFTQSTLGDFLFASSIETSAYVERAREKAALGQLRAEKEDEYVTDETNKPPNGKRKPPCATPRERKSRALEFNLDRPPNNSRFNLFYFFSDKKRKDNSTPSSYEMFARLIRNLYGDHPLLTQGLEYRLLDALLEKRDECKELSKPDAIAQIALSDSALQEIFFAMLTGQLATEDRSYPRLLDYLSHETPAQRTVTPHLNVLFAHEEVLHAFIVKPGAVEKFLAFREKLWAQICYEEAHRNELKIESALTRQKIQKLTEAALIEAFDREQLIWADYKPLFDCSLGRMGSVLFLYDPLTGLTRREWVL